VAKKWSNIAVVPLQNMVFFPKTILPVVIGDSLHMDLILDHYKHKDPLVLSLFQHPFSGEKPSLVGTVGEIIDLQVVSGQNYGFERDRILKIMCHGIAAVDLLEQKEDEQFLFYDVQERNSFCPEESSEEFYLLKKDLKNLFIKWAHLHLGNSQERETFLAKVQSAEEVTNHVATFLLKDISVKQLLLETNDMEQRMRMMSAVFGHGQHFFEDTNSTAALKQYGLLGFGEENKTTVH